TTDFIAEFTAQLTATNAVKPTEALVLGVQSTDEGPVLVAPGLDETAVTALQDQLQTLGVKGAADEVTRVAGAATQFEAKPVVPTGIGSSESPAACSPTLDNSSPGNISAEALRRAAGAATAKMSGITEITVALPAESAAHLTAVAEGSVL